MGRDPNEKRNSAITRRKGPEPVLFLVYRPTEQQRKAIMEIALPAEACMDILYPLLEQGHRLTWGYKPENNAVFLHLREGNVDYDRALTLSCWHATWLRCLQMMAYAVVHVYPEFPLVQTRFDMLAPDW